MKSFKNINLKTKPKLIIINDYLSDSYINIFVELSKIYDIAIR